MLQLADTSVRLYRKKTGSVAVRLHSYIMIHAKEQGFRLSAYLNQFDCTVTLESGEIVILDDYQYTYDCMYRMEHMIHELWASGSVELERMSNTAGKLRVVYRLFSHSGQGTPDVIERVVPVLARGPWCQRGSADPRKWKKR